MYCENCGNHIPDNSKFCFACGTKIVINEAALNGVKIGDTGSEAAVEEAAASIEGAANEGISSDSAVGIIDAYEKAAGMENTNLETDVATQDSAAAIAVNDNQISEIKKAQAQTDIAPQPIEQQAQAAEQQAQPIEQQAQAAEQQAQPIERQAQAAEQQAQPVQQRQAPQVDQWFEQPIQPLRDQPAEHPDQVTRQPAIGQDTARTAPLPVWKYIGIFLIMGIPLVGQIMVFVWAFGSSFNKNTRNYARALLIMALVVILVSIAGYIFLWQYIQDFITNFEWVYF